MNKTARVLAIDLGASSGRGIVFELDGGKLTQNTVHRFPNGAVERDGKLYWDLDMLYAETVTAIKLACRECGEIHSVGIDTWGVDVVTWAKTEALCAMNFVIIATKTTLRSGRL